MSRLQWSRLNHLQIGTYAEYLTKMEFTMWGWQVYTSEVDDRGVDFVARHDNGPFFEIQVKAVRGFNYVYCTKDKFALREELLLALLIFKDEEQPSMFLIPSFAWRETDALLVSRDYEGKKSAPEWGVCLSAANLSLLRRFDFSEALAKLTPAPPL